MKSVLWVSRSGDYSSFSRITESVLPEMSKFLDITLLSSNNEKLDVVKKVVIGSDSKSIKYSDYFRGSLKTNKNILAINMNYCLIQIADLIAENKYDYLVICNGIYEVGYFVDSITKNKFILGTKDRRTKLVIWSPIDYIPSSELINKFSEVDIFLTMTPVMSEIIKSKIENFKGIVDWVGHGSDIGTSVGANNKKKLIKSMNNKRNSTWIGSPIKESDIIILNANNCKHTTRKRLDITISAFYKYLKNNPDSGVKLWIHTDLATLSCQKFPELTEIKESVILSNNNVSDKILSEIYNICQINIQTSTGEGWSLTNMESTLYGSLQIVPDFLATGFHFKDRGLLIPVTLTTEKNEIGQDVTVGIVSIEDTANKIKEAVTLVKNGLSSEIVQKAQEYTRQYTWNSISKKLIEKLH